MIWQYAIAPVGSTSGGQKRCIGHAILKLFKRVCTLPRNSTTSRSGRANINCALRRKLDDPSFAPPLARPCYFLLRIQRHHAHLHAANRCPKSTQQAVLWAYPSSNEPQYQSAHSADLLRSAGKSPYRRSLSTDDQDTIPCCFDHDNLKTALSRSKACDNRARVSWACASAKGIRECRF